MMLNITLDVGLFGDLPPLPFLSTDEDRLV